MVPRQSWTRFVTRKADLSANWIWRVVGLSVWRQLGVRAPEEVVASLTEVLLIFGVLCEDFIRMDGILLKKEQCSSALHCFQGRVRLIPLACEGKIIVLTAVEGQGLFSTGVEIDIQSNEIVIKCAGAEQRIELSKAQALELITRAQRKAEPTLSDLPKIEFAGWVADWSALEAC